MPRVHEDDVGLQRDGLAIALRPLVVVSTANS